MLVILLCSPLHQSRAPNRVHRVPLGCTIGSSILSLYVQFSVWLAGESGNSAICFNNAFLRSSATFHNFSPYCPSGILPPNSRFLRSTSRSCLFPVMAAATMFFMRELCSRRSKSMGSKTSSSKWAVSSSICIICETRNSMGSSRKHFSWYKLTRPGHLSIELGRLP